MLEIVSMRKGCFKAYAQREFDTEIETFWPLVLAEGTIDGLLTLNKWREGEIIEPRGSLISSWKVIE